MKTLNANLQPPSFDWIQSVVVSSLIVLAVAGGVMMPLERFMHPNRLALMPLWLRWGLVIPTAIVLGLLGEVLPRLILACFELITNHSLVVRPGVDFVIWQLWSPMLFVAGGIQMAPTRKAVVFAILGGLKIWVASTNLANIYRFVESGEPWTAVDPLTNSPIWWNSIVLSVCLVVLGAAGISLIRQDFNAEKEASSSRRL